jgi:DNA-binding beta-propeller fold protein YncE
MDRGNRPVTTINDLNRISVVGSTAFIVDGHGRTISADPNPYGVAIAPTGMPASANPGSLKPGDIVVTNFGANSMGTTLVRFPAGKGPGLLFNTMTNPGTKGPALEAFNTLTGSDWVANFSANNVQVFKLNGTILVTITSPLLKMPWAQASNHGMHNPMDGSVTSFFTTNAGDATIDRIDVIPNKNGTTFRVFQIGQLTQMNGGTKIGLAWVPSLQIGGRHYSDVLLALDLANNRVAAYPNSTTLNTTNMRSASKGITAFQGKPLNTPASLTVNPLNGDLLVVNANDNNLVELNLSQGKAVGVRLLDNVPVDAQSGNGSALVGVAANVDGRGNLEVFFTDDNTNTLNLLSI